MRQASPFSKQRELLDDALDKLRKYATDPEWQDLPGYEGRVSKNIEAARAAFGNILNMLGTSKDVPSKKNS